MLKRLAGTIIALIALTLFAHAATLLPNGEQTFLDSNGQPLAFGKVYFYIPNTLTPKSTYQNSSQSVSNTNPVTLDQAGRAIIYGSGQYRQIVTDNAGNLIWDQITTDTSATSYSWSGTSGGTANAITLTASGFTSGDGQQIAFIAGLSNTGAVTVSVNGGSPINVVKATSSGPISLTGGDIIAGNQYEITYSATNGNFQISALPAQSILTAQPLASAATTDLGTIATHNITITGSTTITSFGASATVASQYYFVTFTGSPLITAGTNLKTLNGQNIQASPGATAFLAYIGSGQWQFINYSAPGSVSIQPEGRLTLSSGVPVLNSTVNSAGSIIYTPYVGNQIPIWNGYYFAPTTFSETTQALSDTSLSPVAAAQGSLYDMFAWSNAGTVVVTRGPAWSSATSRGYTLNRVNGISVNGAAITNGPAAGYGTYVGTIMTDTTGAAVTFAPQPTGASGGPTTGSSGVNAGAWVGLWNMYNRAELGAAAYDIKASWTYSSASWHAADASNNNRITFVTGAPEDSQQFTYQNNGGTASSGFAIGVGVDSTSALTATMSFSNSLFTNGYVSTVAIGLLGSHYAQALEASSTGTTTYYGLQTNNSLTAPAMQLAALLRF